MADLIRANMANEIRFALYSGAFSAQMSDGAAWAVLAYHDRDVIPGIFHG